LELEFAHSPDSGLWCAEPQLGPSSRSEAHAHLCRQRRYSESNFSPLGVPEDMPVCRCQNMDIDCIHYRIKISGAVSPGPRAMTVREILLVPLALVNTPRSPYLVCTSIIGGWFQRLPSFELNGNPAVILSRRLPISTATDMNLWSCTPQSHTYYRHKAKSSPETTIRQFHLRILMPFTDILKFSTVSMFEYSYLSVVHKSWLVKLELFFV
jgi:hypothetical protein